MPIASGTLALSATPPTAVENTSVRPRLVHLESAPPLRIHTDFSSSFGPLSASMPYPRCSLCSPSHSSSSICAPSCAAEKGSSLSARSRASTSAAICSSVVMGALQFARLSDDSGGGVHGLRGCAVGDAAQSEL